MLHAVLEDEKRTTSRALSSQESELAELEGKLASEKQQHKFINEATQPVRVRDY